jgi:hypothetical protein
MAGYLSGKNIQEKLEKKWGKICISGNYFVSLQLK